MPKRLLLAGLVLLIALRTAPARGQWPDDWSPFQPVEGLDVRDVRALGAGERYVWIGSADNLYRYDGNAAILWLSDRVDAILVDQENVMWFAGGGGLYWSTDERERPEPVFSDTRATCLYQTSDGELWVGTLTGARRIDTQSREQLQEILILPDGPAPIVQTIGEDPRGRLWLGTQSAGVWRYDPDTDELRPGSLSPEQVGAVHALFQDSAKSFWLGSDGGLFHYTDGSWEPDAAVTEGAVRAVFEDKDQNLWLGTSQGLIRRADQGEGDQDVFTADEGLPGDSVFALLEDPWEGALWVGTESGVARMEGRFWQTYTTDDGLPNPFVRGIAPDGAGGLWIGTVNGALCQFKGDRCQVVAGMESQSIRSLWWDREREELWIAARKGLYRYDGQRLEQGPQGVDVLAAARDTSGRLWMSTRKELLVYDGALVSVEPQGTWSEIAQVNSIYADGLGYLWFGTEDGLVRCTEANPPRCDPPYLSGRDVRQIADDGASNLWMATNGGVFLYLRAVDETSPAPVFSMAEGLPSDSVYGIHRDAHGDVWFGTEGGLTRYIPGTQHPGLVFDEGTATVRDHDQVALPFQLKGSDFRANPGRLLYSYVLERDGAVVERGLTDAPALTLAELDYRHLWGDRDYQLRVQALDRDLRLSDEAVLDIVVTPRPLWSEPWFPYAAGVSLVLLVLGGFGVREARRRRGRFAYRHDIELEAMQAQPDSLSYGVVVRAQRVRALPWFSRTSLAIHQLRIDKALGEALPVSPDVLEKLFEQDNVALGRALYRSLVPEELQQEIEDRAASPRYGLRLRLRFDQAVGLATLPWELMYGGENLGFLGQREDTALGRYIARGTLQRQWVSKQLKVLVVLALPKDVERLDLVAEKERLEQTLGDIERVEVAYLAGVNAATLLGEDAPAQKLQPQISDRLREKDGWDVVHFVGHAGLDRLPEPGTQAEVVLWSEDENGDYEALDADRLGTMLKGLPSQSTPKLIVLNACETAHIESKLVKAILDSGVGAVVGMQWPVADVTGLAFTQGFYSTLEAHGQVDRAVSVARNEMAQIEPERRDWAAPVLVMQIDDGFIFKRA